MRRLRLIYRATDGGGGGSDGRPAQIDVEVEGSRCMITSGEKIERGELVRLPDGRVSFLLESGRQVCGRLAPASPGEVELSRRGEVRRLSLAEPLQDRLAHSGELGSGQDAEEEIRAQMPGRVVEVAVAAGDRVEARSLLLVLEAMKMQNEIRTARGGLVTRVAVEAGKAVEGGALLAVVRQDRAGVAPEPRSGA